jgi:hypothetical protein
MDLGRLAPASEVTAGGHTLPFLKGHGLPILKWYGMSSCDLGAKRPRSISNLSGLCQTRKTPTLGCPYFSKNSKMLAKNNRN